MDEAQPVLILNPQEVGVKPLFHDERVRVEAGQVDQTKRMKSQRVVLGLEKTLTEEKLSEGLPPGRDFTLKPSKAGTFESLRWERISRAEAKLSTHLSPTEVESVKNVLWERASCFSDQPGTYKGVE